VLDPAGRGTAAQVQDGVRRAADALADADYVVEELEPPGIEEAARILLVMLSTPGIRSGWELSMGPIMPSPARCFMSDFFEAAGEPDAVAVEQAFIDRHSLLRAWGEFQGAHPLILAPIATEPPRMAGTDLDDGQVAEDIRTMRMAMAVNALGLPAVAVAVGVADGLPQAVQVIGPRYREDMCLEAAGVIEDRLGIFTPIEPG